MTTTTINQNSPKNARSASFFKKLGFISTFLFFALTTAGMCQKTGTVVFYRQSAYTAALSKVVIFANGKEITRIGNGKKQTVKLPVGDYVLQAKPNRKFPINIKVLENDTLYINTHIQVGLATVKFKMTNTEKNQGKQEADLLKEGSN